MKVEFSFCDIDEISLGIFMMYGDDENGIFHLISLGFLFFVIDIYRYKK